MKHYWAVWLALTIVLFIGSTGLWSVADDLAPAPSHRGFILGGHRAAVTAVAFSPDGRFLVSGSADHTLRLWNIQTKRTAYVLSGHTDTVTGAAFTADGTQIISGGLDGKILFWSVATGKMTNGRGAGGPISCFALSPNGSKLAFGTADGGLCCGDSLLGGGGIIEHAHRGRINQVFWVPQTKRFWSVGDDERWRVWTLKKGGPHPVKKSPAKQEAVASFTSLGGSVVAFSPDGLILAVADIHQQGGQMASGLSLKKWPTLEPIASGLAAHEPLLPPLNALAFSPSGQTLAGAGSDGKIYCWDVSWLKALQPTQDKTKPLLAMQTDEDGEDVTPTTSTPLQAISSNPDMGKPELARWPELSRRIVKDQGASITVTNASANVLKVAIRLRDRGVSSTQGCDMTLTTEKHGNSRTVALPDGAYDIFYMRMLEPGILRKVKDLIVLRSWTEGNTDYYDRNTVILEGKENNNTDVLIVK